MFLSFLANINIRPIEAQFLWVFYNQLDKLEDPHVFYVLTEEYLKNYKDKRRELASDFAQKHFYDPRHALSHMETNFENLKYKIVKLEDIPLSPYSKLTKQVWCYRSELAEQLNPIIDKVKPKTGLTWVNNWTLHKCLSDRNIPLIHNELGPLRSPIYKDTFYFDFNGVNGGSEFEERFSKFQEIAHEFRMLTNKELLSLVCKKWSLPLVLDILNNKDKELFEVGLPLQVFDDTNIIAFAQNWDMQGLVNYAVGKHGSQNVLIRNHPHSQFSCNLDNTHHGTCLDFLSKVKKVTTINSSVGFEALLLGKEAEFLGENPFSILPNLSSEDLRIALNFAIISYLVPIHCLYNEDYYDFRLQNMDDERALYQKGLEVWNIAKIMEG